VVSCSHRPIWSAGTGRARVIRPPRTCTRSSLTCTAATLSLSATHTISLSLSLQSLVQSGLAPKVGEAFPSSSIGRTPAAPDLQPAQAGPTKYLLAAFPPPSHLPRPDPAALFFVSRPPHISLRARPDHDDNSSSTSTSTIPTTQRHHRSHRHRCLLSRTVRNVGFAISTTAGWWQHQQPAQPHHARHIPRPSIWTARRSAVFFTSCRTRPAAHSRSRVLDRSLFSPFLVLRLVHWRRNRHHRAPSPQRVRRPSQAPAPPILHTPHFASRATATTTTATATARPGTATAATTTTTAAAASYCHKQYCCWKLEQPGRV